MMIGVYGYIIINNKKAHWCKNTCWWTRIYHYDRSEMLPPLKKKKNWGGRGGRDSLTRSAWLLLCDAADSQLFYWCSFTQKALVKV